MLLPDKREVSSSATKLEHITGTLYKLTMANGEIANVAITPEFISTTLKNDFSPEFVQLDETGNFLELNETFHIRVNKAVRRGFRLILKNRDECYNEPTLGGILWSKIILCWDPFIGISLKHLSFRELELTYADMKTNKIILSNEVINLLQSQYGDIIETLKNKAIILDKFGSSINFPPHTQDGDTVIATFQNRRLSEPNMDETLIQLIDIAIPATADDLKRYCNDEEYGL